eukprot:gene14585-19587_t
MSGTGWIISLVVLVVAICAGLAALGFRGRVTTIGVDLGTTFSVVGINVNGKVIIIEDKQGRRIFPSVVSFMDNGEILAAYEALPQLSKYPLNTIYNAKRFIGRSLEDESVKQYANDHSFKVVESNLSNFSKVGFQINATGHDSNIITPEQVGTQVLKFLLKITSDYLGHKQVNKAVIAVPAKFDANQRKATGEAYKQAGLKVVRVIEEPTAAAVAYKLHKKSNIHHILVYDFGGGTLDVSLLFVSKGSVQVYATDGDETLGGSDIDLCLYKTIKERMYEKFSIDITDAISHTSLSSHQEDEFCTPPAVHTKSENTKKMLTHNNTVLFNCNLLPSQIVIQPDGQRASSIEFMVTKEDLEIGCSHLFERALLPVTRLLHDLSMNREDIDEVVLVGGSTRIPLVKQQLRSFFGKELNDHIDPDVTVAYGAASILD